MGHIIRSPRLAGLTSAVSMIAPVFATMLYMGKLDWPVLAMVGLLSLPFYFLTRNRILLEKEHPGWRGE